MACKRNAFVMLVNCAPELAVEYLEANINQVPNMDELLQMAIVDLIRKDCKNNAANKVSLALRVFTGSWAVLLLHGSQSGKKTDIDLCDLGQVHSLHL